VERWLFALTWLVAAALSACKPSAVAPPPRGTSPPSSPLAVPCPPPPPKPDGLALAAGLEPYLADMIRSPMAEITAPPAPFLRCGAIYDVEYFGRYHPTYFHVAWLQERPTRALSQPSKLLAFVREAGLMLDTEERRTTYVKTFIRLDAAYQQLLESVQDFRFTVARDMSDPSVAELLSIDPQAPIRDQIALRRHIEDVLGKRIKPLRLPGSAPWRGAIHAIKKPVMLVRLDVTLGPSGDVGFSEKTLITGVPVTMVVP
jgi:hypothetical protein